MHRKLTTGALTALALSLAVGIAYASTVTYGSVGVRTADSYVSTGDTNSGWDWLQDRDYADSSTFTFKRTPRKTKNGKIYLRLAFLVTNKAGGSGYGTKVKVTFPRSRVKSKVVKLKNLTPVKDAADTNGYGYTANGTAKISAKKVPRSRTLRVKVTRIRNHKKLVATQAGDGYYSGLMLLWRK